MGSLGAIFALLARWRPPAPLAEQTLVRPGAMQGIYPVNSCSELFLDCHKKAHGIFSAP